MNSKLLAKLKDQMEYHSRKLGEFQKVYALCLENPQMEQALDRLLKALEDVNLI